MPEVPLWACGAFIGLVVGVLLGGVRDVLHEVAESTRRVHAARHRDHRSVPSIK